jgi:16S rRNA (cytosine967-C5)-methyltransferase
VLRWQRTLDAALSRHSKRAIDRLDPQVRAPLRIGLFEAATLDVPPAVATDGAVHLARRLGRSSAGGLVNAVLRRTIPEWSRLVSDGPADLRYSHPEWLFSRWSSTFGFESAVEAMAAAQEPADVWVWWIDAGVRSEMGEAPLIGHLWCPDAWTFKDGGSELVAAVRRGAAYAQDPSSQMVAHLARRLASSDARTVDLCAAPGGKSALWRRLGGDGEHATMDRHLGRARLMVPLLDRVGGASVVVGDAGEPPFWPAAWDLVLVDAPCTGTGTFRRHPELKSRLAPESIPEMAKVQERILSGAFELVAPGGVVVYATCSVEPEENEDHFDALPEGFESEDPAGVLPAGVPWIPTDAGGVRILPNLNGDGFTIHALRRAEF